MTGKSGRVVGHLMGFLLTLKGLPSTYNKDMQALPPDSPRIAHRGHICTGTGANPCHICTGTGGAPTCTHAHAHARTHRLPRHRRFGRLCVGRGSTAFSLRRGHCSRRQHTACDICSMRACGISSGVLVCCIRAALPAEVGALGCRLWGRRTRSRCLTSSTSSRFDTVAPRRAYAKA